MSEAFNVEEFLVFGSEIPSENIQESSQEPASNWPAYPDMFPAEEQRLKEDPISLISFEGASLYKEEYVDPFASLSPKYEANSRDFLTKLQLRRKKLDNLARNLQSKNPLEQWTHLEDSLLVLPWQKEVQVYSLFNVESNTLATGAHQDFSKQLSSEAYLARKMLDFFQQSLPEYLAIMFGRTLLAPFTPLGMFAVPKMTLKMNACLFTAYGGPEVLKYAQVDKPTPKEDQLLVKIKNTTAFMGDCEVRRLEMPLGLGYLFRLGFGILKPKFPTILGQEFSGIVESCGAKVDKFKVGDEVFGTKEIPFGTYAEYACVDPKSTILKPDYLTFPEAAALPIGSAEAIHFLDLANIKPGTKVLVIGAGGSIGTYAVQYAKHLGAVVTGVDHPSKFDLLKQIGCSGTIDYTTTDITQVPEKFDVVYDGAAKSTVPIMKKCLTPDGKVVIGTPTWGQLIQSLYDSRVLIKFPDTHDGHLKTALELCKTGAMKPVIDPKRFKLEQMAEAHAYAESGLKRGSIVVDVFE